MGNKHGTAYKKKKTTKEPSYPDLKLQMQCTLDEMIPNTTNGYNISKNPMTSDEDLSIICPLCDKKTINEGIENYITCRHCNKKFKQRGDEMVLPGNGQRDITDFNLNDQIFPYHESVESIPEIQALVLSVIGEKIPTDIKFAGEVNFYTLTHKHILPFFEQNVRIVKKNNFFSINGMHFKVLSSVPPCGRVSKDTFIHCYKEIKLYKKLQKVKLMPCQQTNLTASDIKNYFAQREYNVHIERDQDIEINGSIFKVVKCSPASGIACDKTEIEIKSTKPLQQLRTLTIACFMDKLPVIVNTASVDRDELEYQLNERVIKPYFEGVERYVKAGESFQIGDFEFTVKTCEPYQGLIDNFTDIQSELFKTKEIYKKKHPKQDGIIEAREEKKDQNVPVTRIVRRRNSSADIFEEEEEIKNEADRNFATREVVRNSYNFQTGTYRESTSESPIKTKKSKTQTNIDNHRQSSDNTNDRRIQTTYQQSSHHRSNNNNNNNSNSNNRTSNSRPSTSNNIQQHSSQNNLNQQNQQQNRQQTQTRPSTSNGNQSRSTQNRDSQQNYQIVQGSRGREIIINNRVINIDEVLANSTGRNAIIINEEQSRNSQSGSRHYNVIIIERDGSVRQARVHKKKNKGASQNEINRLPVREIDTTFLKDKELTSEDLLKCSICIADYENGDKIRTMPCLHYFHKECLDQWLLKNKVCPLCKTSASA